jgi:hypothetical protein
MANRNSRSVDMQYISSTAKGFVVKFFGKADDEGARPLEAYQTFLIREYGSTVAAREAAQRWRDDQKAVFRRHPSAITSTIAQTDSGLIQARWNVAYAGKRRELSMRRFGYAGAYKKALTALEQLMGTPLPIRPSPPPPSAEQAQLMAAHHIQIGEVMVLPPEGIRLSVRRTSAGFVRAEWLVDVDDGEGGSKIRTVSMRKCGFQQSYISAVAIREASTGKPVTGIIPLPDDGEAEMLAEIGVALVVEDKRRLLVM